MLLGVRDLGQHWFKYAATKPMPKLETWLYESQGQQKLKEYYCQMGTLDAVVTKVICSLHLVWK